jgi:Uma2 family endonuclease
MSTITPMAAADSIVYPESDGQPMAENTLQFEWIVTVKEGLAVLFRDRPDFFVAGDLLWYPVQGLPKIRVAPDAMVAFGRPKGYRGSYLQWKEDDIPPRSSSRSSPPATATPRCWRNATSTRSSVSRSTTSTTPT